MPLYEYECESCAQRFERIQKFSDPPVDTCPSCGGAVKKLFSSPAIQFKGAGWYITDYARKGSSASSEGKSDSTPSSEGGAAAGSSKESETTKSPSESSNPKREKPPAASNE